LIRKKHFSKKISKNTSPAINQDPEASLPLLQPHVYYNVKYQKIGCPQIWGKKLVFYPRYPFIVKKKIYLCYQSL
jgi:hypothetical protein